MQFYQNTLAKQIIFQGKTAKGVKVVSSGLEYTLKARKGVVLAAGAVGFGPCILHFLAVTNLWSLSH